MRVPKGVLLTFATDFIVPVDERALRVVAPCPDVQFEERWKVVAVGAGDEEEGLAFEDGRGGMILQPRCGIDDEFNTDEAEFAMAGFVDELTAWASGIHPSDMSIPTPISRYSSIILTPFATPNPMYRST